MHTGTVIARERFVDIMRAEQPDFTQSQIDKFIADQRGPSMLHIRLTVEDHIRTIWAGPTESTLEKWRSADKLISRQQAQGWAAALETKLRRGRPSTAMIHPDE